MNTNLKSLNKVMPHDIKQFREIINFKKIIYLMTICDTELQELFWTEEELKESTEDAWTTEQYIKAIRRFIKEIYNKSLEQIPIEGEEFPPVIYPTEYKYAFGRNYGRLYTKQFSIQSLQKRLRNFLVTDDKGKSYYTDLDIENCHYSILLGYIQNYNDGLEDFEKLNTKFISEYVRKRKKYLKKYDLDKKTFLIILNIDNVTTDFKEKNAFYINDDGSEKSWFLKGIHHEISEIKNLLWKHDNLAHYKKDCEKRKNPKSSFLNRILCNEEAKYLQLVIQELSASCLFKSADTYIVPMFDGFMINRNINKETLVVINKWTRQEHPEYNSIKWVVKPIVDESDISAEYIEETIKNSDLYIIKKKKWDENHCWIQSKGSYFIKTFQDEQRTPIWRAMNKQAMIEGGKNKRCTSVAGKESDMFTEWSKDPTRREYKIMLFKPYNPKEEHECKIDPDIFNTFEGMGFEYDPKYEYSPDPDLKDFLLNTLGDGDEEIYKYLYYTLAQIIQQPTVRTNIATIMVGEQGTGKDTFGYLIGKLINDEYTISTNKLEDIVPKESSFNMELKDKLVVRFNEMKAKDGNNYIEQIKDFVTREVNRIRELYQAPYVQDNICRLIFNSNSNIVMALPPGQRRFVQIKTSSNRKGDNEYWGDLYSKFKNKDYINLIGNELLNVDFGDYFSSTSNYPKTEMMNTITELSRPKEADFLYHGLIGDECKLYNDEFVYKGDKVYIPTKTLYHCFDEYREDNGIVCQNYIPLHLKNFMLHLPGVENNKTRTINKKRQRMYCFDYKVMKEALQAKFNYVDEEPTNLDNLEFLPEEKETVATQVNNPYFKDYLKDELGE